MTPESAHSDVEVLDSVVVLGFGIVTSVVVVLDRQVSKLDSSGH